MTIIEWVQQELINQSENATILEIFKTGSQLFIKNPNDIDIIVILDGYTQRRRKTIFNDGLNTWDVIFIDKLAVTAQLDFNVTSYIPYPIKLYNYFYMIRDKVYGDYQVDWNILDHEEQYIDYLKQSYKENLKGPNTGAQLGKSFVHYYIPLKWFENQSTEITGEMNLDIQALYARDETALPAISWVMNKLDTED